MAEPEQKGLLYYYRGIIHYVSKKHEKPERINKDEDIALMRVHRACEHKRWGRAPWYIIDIVPTNGRSASRVEPVEEVEEFPSATGIDPADDFFGVERAQGVDEPSLSAQVRPLASAQSIFTPELPDDDSVQDVAEKLKMVSDASRLKVILVLSRKERNATELCEDLRSESQPAVSHHLSLLRHARLVEQRRDGKHHFYNLTEDGRVSAGLTGKLFS